MNTNETLVVHLTELDCKQMGKSGFIQREDTGVPVSLQKIMMSCKL